jgi:hypothetical protein
VEGHIHELIIYELEKKARSKKKTISQVSSAGAVEKGERRGD